MDSATYNFKYSILYPLAVFLLYSILTVMGLAALNQHFRVIDLDIFLIIAISIFLLEAVIRVNASQELSIPRLFFILEIGLYLLVLRFLTGGFYNIGLWLVWVLSL